MDAETCRGIPKGQLFNEMHDNMGLILQSTARCDRGYQTVSMEPI